MIETSASSRLDPLKGDFKLLVVDDNENNRFTLSRRLRRDGYSCIREAVDGRDALDKMLAVPFDLVLLDIMMPEMDGYQVLEAMKGDKDLRRVPVIVISAISEMDSVVRCIELGAEDYLPKPFDPVLLRARVGASLEKKWLREVEASYLKFHDIKTGLANRDKFALYLAQSLGEACTEQGCHWVLRISLDQFKDLVESFGAAFGEEVVKAQVERIQGLLRRSDYLARYADNEFILLVTSWGTGALAQVGIEQLRNSLRMVIHAGDREVASPVSIGAYQVTGKEVDAEEIIRHAGLAAGMAAREGGNRFRIYDPDSHERAVERLQLENDLRRAVEQQQLVLFYQPIIRVADGAFVGAESLLRWRHSSRGMVSPGLFVPLAEENGEIIPIGHWVLREALRQAAAWRAAGVFAEDSFVNINVSGRQFEPGDLVRLLTEALGEFQLPTRNMKLEITESAIMGNPRLALDTLEQLSQLGARLAIDDFGTGYSSFSYLYRFPFNTLKIDRSFICDIHQNQKNLKIVRAINGLAGDLGMDVVAEGVETAEEVEVLRELRVAFIQGYYYSRPLSAADLPAFVAANRAARGAGASAN